jgi:hypothetical protein
MTREIFCHEEELLRRFAFCEFGRSIIWCKAGLTDDIWGQSALARASSSRRFFNVNFRTEYAHVGSPEYALTKVAQIHPGYLTPAVFVSVDKMTNGVYSVELMNGEGTRLSDYPIATARIEEIADGVTKQVGFNGQLKWWRLFAMFDRIFFLTLRSNYNEAIHAQRDDCKLPVGLNGECVGLYIGQELIGLDGWFEQGSGFGVDAAV